MTATYSEAVDAMFKVLNDAWVANAPAIVGSVPEIRWQGIEGKTKPAVNVFWAIVSTHNVFDGQSTLKVGIEPSENRRYTAAGYLLVQIFCPLSDAQAFDKGRRLAAMARNAFRGVETPNSVWFRKARINEISPTENAYRFNVSVEYEYDDIG